MLEPCFFVAKTEKVKMFVEPSGTKMFELAEDRAAAWEKQINAWLQEMGTNIYITARIAGPGDSYFTIFYVELPKHVEQEELCKNPSSGPYR